MAFPDVLNLNPFVVKDERAERKSTDEATNSESGEAQDNNQNEELQGAIFLLKMFPNQKKA